MVDGRRIISIIGGTFADPKARTAKALPPGRNTDVASQACKFRNNTEGNPKEILDKIGFF